MPSSAVRQSCIHLDNNDQRVSSQYVGSVCKVSNITGTTKLGLTFAETVDDTPDRGGVKEGHRCFKNDFEHISEQLRGRTKLIRYLTHSHDGTENTNFVVLPVLRPEDRKA